jgi:lipopolysaccharide transport system permease protein
MIQEKISLILTFTKRDFTQKYIGTSLGQYWFILSPVIMIAIYSIIFSNVMILKLGITQNPYAYSVYLVSGLFAWVSFSTLLSTLTNSIDTNAHYLKKISIPMYVFQISAALSQAIVLCISMLLAVLFLVIVDFPLSIMLLLLLPLMALQLLFTFSLGVILSLFVPFFKDIKVVLPIVLQLWFWITPIIYFKDIVPQKYHILFTINPFYYFIESYHAIFLYAQAPCFDHIARLGLLTLLLFALATYLYKKMLPTVKDIL